MSGEALIEAVLGVLHRMVWADGDADPREIEVGTDVARRMLGDRVSEAQVARILRTPSAPDCDLAAVPTDARLIVLRAAAAVAGADSRIEDSEIGALRALGHELQLNPAVVDSVIAGLVDDTAARGELDALRAVAAGILGVDLDTPVIAVHERYLALCADTSDEELADQLTWAYHTLST